MWIVNSLWVNVLARIFIFEIYGKLFGIILNLWIGEHSFLLLLSFLFFLTFLCSVFSTLLVPKSPPRFQGPVHKPTEGKQPPFRPAKLRINDPKKSERENYGLKCVLCCVCVCSKHFNQNHFITSHWLSCLHFCSTGKFMHAKFVKFRSLEYLVLGAKRCVY